MPPATNCVLYARVSTSEQAEKQLSIPAQLQTMRDHAARNGWNVIKEFIEPGASAKTANRPVLQELLALAKDARSAVGVVLVHKIDRLARNVFDHATIRALLKQRGIRLASCVENVDDSVSGQLVENIMASIAQFYSGNLAEEVRKGMRQKVMKGGWPHKPPRGYIQVRRDDGESSVEVHPTDGPVMKRAFELYATGHYSLKGLASRLAKEGIQTKAGHQVAAQYLRDLLTNPFYTGRLRWRDLLVEGRQTPLVSETLFEQVRSVLKRRFTAPGAKSKPNGFPLRGIAICASCRGHMTASWQRSGWNGKRWGYYRCARRIYNKRLCGGAPACPARKAHADIENTCADLEVSDQLIEAVVLECSRILEERLKDHRNRSQALAGREQKLRAQEMRLTKGFVEGDVSPGAYKQTLSTIRAELEEINCLANGMKEPRELLPKIRTMLSPATNLSDVGQMLNDGRRAEFLRIVFQRVVLDETGVTGFVLNRPFDTLLRRATPDRDAVPDIATDVLAFLQSQSDADSLMRRS